MKKRPQKSVHLSSKKLKELVKDGSHDKPNIWAFVVFETVENLFYLVIIFILIAITRPIWHPVWDFTVSAVDWIGGAEVEIEN